METEGSSGRPASDDVEELRRSLGEQQDRYLRLLAEFENVRRRMAREHERARHEGRRDALLALLPALDTLERALAAGSTDTPFYEGVVATHRLFLDALRELGAEPVQSEGQPFDPNQHEAIPRHPPTMSSPELSRARCDGGGGSDTSCFVPHRSSSPLARRLRNRGGEIPRLLRNAGCAADGDDR